MPVVIGWPPLHYTPCKPEKETFNEMAFFFWAATLVAAAFIGPGTVTVCTIAGATHGYDLLWALLFSVIATLILQEMAARLGFTTRKGLGEAIRFHTPKGFIRLLFIFIQQKR